jgi:hypothetical protein
MLMPYALKEAQRWVTASPGVSWEQAMASILRRLRLPHYQNSRYHVAVDADPPGMVGCIHLDIRRRDNQPIGPEHFPDLQRIKNELVGAEHDSYERYPPESMLRDVSNTYHLWVYKAVGPQLPFGFTERLVGTATWETNKQTRAAD